jgi:hypothetical protein
MSECTNYSDDGDFPAQCPKCKGWLKWIYNEEESEDQPICNKCHTPLIIIPDTESTEDCQWGKICIIKPLQDSPVTTEPAVDGEIKQ